MKKTEEIMRMERDLNENPELREKLDAEIKRIIDAKETESDGETMAKAAAVLGYAVSPEELERAVAELEAVDDDELKDVTGGCEDEYGHDLWCITAWHCSLVTLFTESEKEECWCFKDYQCPVFYHHLPAY